VISRKRPVLKTASEPWASWSKAVATRSLCGQMGHVFRSLFFAMANQYFHLTLSSCLLVNLAEGGFASEDLER
ncbi:hypothetical protein OAA19_02180, partial [Rubripirellula sp.]|nr:hypothetical protein [Rubripirellula sp.]